MAEIRGFLKKRRSKAIYRPVCERVQDYKEVSFLRTVNMSKEQASRCMDCGTPFCHWGCPLGNYIPEWNDYVHQENWQKAYNILSATNPMPEVTGRICPAVCEYACVLGKNDDAVTIRENELDIIENSFRYNYIKPNPPKKRTGKKIAIVGSGPAGLACASELNKVGHEVVVFERSDKVGGILRYGIPDFKLEKNILDRRVEIWEKEGIVFKTGVEVGKDYKIDSLIKDFNAVSLACGSSVARELKIEGRNLKGIYFAMDYLIQANKIIAGTRIPKEKLIDVKNKKVVVIGGGDTGADCIGCANRQKAACITQIEILPRPSECRTADFSWPKYPMLLKTSTSHEEGSQREWAVLTKKFIGESGKLKKLSCVRVEFVNQTPNTKHQTQTCLTMQEIHGSEFEIEADVVILAMGFLHPEHSGLVKDLQVALDDKGNIKTDKNFKTSIDKIFCAGDARRGQSLVVWALYEGRCCAYNIDKYLMGDSDILIM